MHLSGTRSITHGYIHICIYRNTNITTRVSECTSIKKADLSHFLNQPGPRTLWISNCPYLQYFLLQRDETTKPTTELIALEVFLCTAELRWAWTFWTSIPGSAGSSWFLWQCMSACKIDILKHSIFMLQVAVLRSKMFRIIFIGQTEALKSWGSGWPQALPA